MPGKQVFIDYYRNDYPRMVACVIANVNNKNARSCKITDRKHVPGQGQQS